MFAAVSISGALWESEEKEVRECVSARVRELRVRFVSLLPPTAVRRDMTQVLPQRHRDTEEIGSFKQLRTGSVQSILSIQSIPSTTQQRRRM